MKELNEDYEKKEVITGKTILYMYPYDNLAIQIGTNIKVVKLNEDKYIIIDIDEEYKSWAIGLIVEKDEFEIINDLKLNNRERIFDSGAKRDSDENKPYVHNLHGYTRLRFGYHTRMGARKYGDGNFENGFPNKSLIQSNDRHWAQYLDGDRSEDHLSAILFGINCLMDNDKKDGIKPDNWFKSK
jgi:hypothetical protein